MSDHIPDDTKMVSGVKDSLTTQQEQGEHYKGVIEGVQKLFDDKRKAKQEQGEPVAWRYKPVREDNPRWEYTTQHPLDMGDGYLRPSLVEYCKCIEPLYATEKPKLMLEKFREMKDLLEDSVQQEPATKEQIREAIVFNLPLYTTQQQRPSRSDIKPLTDEQIDKAWRSVDYTVPWEQHRIDIARAIEAAHGIKENT